MRLASNGYAGANHSHFTELLREREGIDLSRPTVRRILVRAGIGSPRNRRSQQHRFRRRRMPQEGMLVQIDGSQHPWLEDRGTKLTLLIAVDDATGTVAQAVFRTTEDTRGYLVLLERLICQWGIPLALYSDRHAAFKYYARQKPVPVETTQFARVMRELGVQQIFALSPQAKGRVERMAGGCPGTGRRRADDQIPRRDRRFSGGTAALVGAVGFGRTLLPRPGTAEGRRRSLPTGTSTKPSRSSWLPWKRPMRRRPM